MFVNYCPIPTCLRSKKYAFLSQSAHRSNSMMVLLPLIVLNTEESLAVYNISLLLSLTTHLSWISCPNSCTSPLKPTGQQQRGSCATWSKQFFMVLSWPARHIQLSQPFQMLIGQVTLMITPPLQPISAFLVPIPSPGAQRSNVQWHDHRRKSSTRLLLMLPLKLFGYILFFNNLVSSSNQLRHCSVTILELPILVSIPFIIQWWNTFKLTFTLFDI